MANFHFTPVQLGRNSMNIAGHQYGRLTAVALVSMRGGRTKWLCDCACGGWAICDTANLRRGNSTSCGCALAEANISRLTSHGMSKTPTYNIWNKMRSRCGNPSDAKYSEYGGRGITVCARWEVFENFLADMGEKPGRRYSIDRINNSGNYEPSNCRWATDTQQARNTRKNTYFTHDGDTKTLAEWAIIFDIKYQTLWARIYRYGWTFDEAVSGKTG